MGRYVPVHEDMRRRFSRRRRLHRDECLALDVRELAESGLLVPGWHEAQVELLGDELSGFAVPTTVVAVMGESAGHVDVDIPDGGEPMAGMLDLQWPRPCRIEVKRRETAAGHRYLLVCPGGHPAVGPCSKPVRMLFVARTPPGISSRGWLCRQCLGFIYKDTRPRRDLHSSALEHLREWDEIARDLLRLREVMVDHLDTPSTRARLASPP
jgi:hypothetical protein